MHNSSKNQKKSDGKWTMMSLAFGAAIGAVLGLIAYNNHWLG
ncbi:hypothetical protein ACTSEZ_16120 [Metabacillus sp. JX24]